MTERYSAFSFVDRIIEFDPGTRAAGRYLVPPQLARFPSCLVAEAVGQLAAWVAMAKLDFRLRPVAGIAGETQFHCEATPGDTLELAADLESCDEDAVAYSGSARVNGVEVVQLKKCVGPMLRMEDFDSPEAVRTQFALLRETGARAGRFQGVEAPEITVTERIPGESLRAEMRVPASAPFFADHFPRRAVFPGTLLLNSETELALELAREATEWTAGQPLEARRITDLKLRSFISPGDVVALSIAVSSRTDTAAEYALVARRGGKNVGSARMEVVKRGAA